MSEPIKAGDFVVVIYGCCEQSRACALGLHATVLHVFSNPDRLCIFCNAPTPDLRAELDHQRWNAPVSWLKRIPPIEELDDVKQDEEITA
jgi:hypothetical protein